MDLAESQAEALVDSRRAVSLLVCGDAGAELGAGLDSLSILPRLLAEMEQKVRGLSHVKR